MVRPIRPGLDPYKPRKELELDRVDKRRLRAGVSVSDLAARAGIELRTLQRIRAGGRAWPREVRALNMALRSIERDARTEGALFPGDEDEAAGEGDQTRPQRGKRRG